MAEDKLTRSQMTIVSTLYVGMASLSSYAATTWTMRGLYFAVQQKALEETAQVYPGQFVPLILALFLGGGIIACLKFMWDVRHRKAG